jgi:hypothetical protein
MGAKAGSGRGLALFALAFLVLYGSFRWVLHERAVAVLEARLYDGRVPLRVAAFPSGPAGLFRWSGLVETGSFYRQFQVDLLREFDPGNGSIAYKPEPDLREAAAAEAARATYAFRVFLDFSQFPLWRFSPADSPDGALRVDVLDLRFGSPAAPGFIASAVVTADGRVHESAFRFGLPPRR